MPCVWHSTLTPASMLCMSACWGCAVLLILRAPAGDSHKPCSCILAPHSRPPSHLQGAPEGIPCAAGSHQQPSERERYPHSAGQDLWSQGGQREGHAGPRHRLHHPRSPPVHGCKMRCPLLTDAVHLSAQLNACLMYGVTDVDVRLCKLSTSPLLRVTHLDTGMLYGKPGKFEQRC